MMDRLSELFRLYYSKTASTDEREEFMELVQNTNSADLAILIRESGENLESFESGLLPEKAISILENILEKATLPAGLPEGGREAVIELESALIPSAKRKHIHFSRYQWWAAAAIFVLFATSSYFLFFNKSGNNKDEIVVSEKDNDIKAPDTNRAMVTLSDGSTVYLDSADNGQLAFQGNVKLVKLSNGQIAYETITGDPDRNLESGMNYNTLSNPKGSKVIAMALSDGSHVWLNAGSSVTYPISFVGNERKVTITGEAYFEITHDKRKPFKVEKANMIVEVLGTHFNVKAYEDESDIKVTLLEGSVKISTIQHTASIILKPGQQAVLTPDSRLTSLSPDLDQVMAWKNGKFQFKRATVASIMRELSRWYDAEIFYENDTVKNAEFTGGIARKENAFDVLKMLEMTGAIRFRIEKNKIIVTK